MHNDDDDNHPRYRKIIHDHQYQIITFTFFIILIRILFAILNYFN